MRALSVNGAKLLFGDFNSRIGIGRPGEESVIGPFVLAEKLDMQLILRTGTC